MQLLVLVNLCNILPYPPPPPKKVIISNVSAPTCELCSSLSMPNIGVGNIRYITSSISHF